MLIDLRSARNEFTREVITPGCDPDVSAREIQTSRRWDCAINRLIEFGQLPAGPDEDGNEPPSSAAIKEAHKFLRKLQLDNLPDTIVLDGEGGIVMERFRGTTTERVEISAEGLCQVLQFKSSRLISQ